MSHSWKVVLNLEGKYPTIRHPADSLVRLVIKPAALSRYIRTELESSSQMKKIVDMVNKTCICFTLIAFTWTATFKQANTVDEGEVGFKVLQLVHLFQPLTGGFFAKTFGLVSCACSLVCCLAHLQGRDHPLDSVLVASFYSKGNMALMQVLCNGYMPTTPGQPKYPVQQHVCKLQLIMIMVDAGQ